MQGMSSGLIMGMYREYHLECLEERCRKCMGISCAKTKGQTQEIPFDRIPGLPTSPVVVQMKEIVQEILPYTVLVHTQEICICPEIGQP